MTTEKQLINPEEIQVIPGFNARSDLGNLEFLEQDIELRGLLTPLWVRPDRANKEQPYILIAGERRLTAIKNIKRRRGKLDFKIAVRVYNVNEDEAEELMVSENLNRENLPISDIACLVSRWQIKGLEKLDIAKKLNRSGSWVDQMLLFNTAQSELKKAVDDGRMTLDAALDFARNVPAAQQEEVLNEVMEETQGDKSKTREAVAKRTGKAIRPGKKKIKELCLYIRENGASDRQYSAQDVLDCIVMALDYSCGEVTQEAVQIKLDKMGVQPVVSLQDEEELLDADDDSYEEASYDDDLDYDEEDDVDDEAQPYTSSKKLTPNQNFADMLDQF